MEWPPWKRDRKSQYTTAPKNREHPLLRFSRPLLPPKRCVERGRHGSHQRARRERRFFGPEDSSKHRHQVHPGTAAGTPTCRVDERRACPLARLAEREEATPRGRSHREREVEVLPREKSSWGFGKRRTRSSVCQITGVDKLERQFESGET